jgi:RNA 2',3'-cyclic 3'-phosphodiesterase
MKRIRTFIAVDVGSGIQSAAQELQKQLSAAGIDAKWVDSLGMHITLQFLGEISERDIHGVCKAMSKVARKQSQFVLKIAGFGAFPNLRRPKILWANIQQGQDELSAIHEALREPLENLGVYRHEDRRFTPHLTLGRCKAGDDVDNLSQELAKFQNWQAEQIVVDSFVLYRSEFKFDEPEYVELNRVHLNG